MILYSKNGDFLGIGKDELSFLGYEDLEEFKNFNNDVADLFVNRPGYIFKFKNFSWIDYALHSGAPKRAAIVRLKTGSEVEVAIRIKELFLYAPINNNDIYYSIELINQSKSSIQEPIIQEATPTLDPEKFALKEIEEHKEIELQEVSFVEDFSEEKEALDIETDESEAEVKTNIISFAEEDFSQDYITEEPLKAKINLPLKDIPAEPEAKISLDDINNIDAKVDERKSEEEVNFDLLHCVDMLGLDISLTGEIITDFMSEIETTIPTIESSIESENEESLRKNIFSLKGVSDNLRMFQLSDKLIDILRETNTELRREKLKKFEAISKRYKSELI